MSVVIETLTAMDKAIEQAGDTAIRLERHIDTAEERGDLEDADLYRQEYKETLQELSELEARRHESVTAWITGRQHLSG